MPPEARATKLRQQVRIEMNFLEATDPTNPHSERAEVLANYWMRVGMNYLEAIDPTSPHLLMPPPFGKGPRKPPGWVDPPEVLFDTPYGGGGKFHIPRWW
jgi:hypothetical protein